ncbi:MAG: helix-turn-helix domain-containing protein [Candidatus Portnoybacteria bacterium]|nr:helix-turn-helix domain-containing protein [Candidatus Portnoybacteria bacterium]
MKVSEKLKIIQNTTNLTQEELAKKLEVSFATLNSWINNRSNPRKNSEKKINNLYLKFTGQKEIIENSLKAKKKIIIDKSKKYKNILKEIINNPDIYDHLALSFTYNTNRIEGSTLTEDETRAILFDNIALPNKSITEQLEVKNHQAAWRYLLNHLIKSSKINEKLILKLHSILMNGIRDDAGTYRKHAVRIVGSSVPTANHLKVPKLMSELIKNINYNKKDIIKHATIVHSKFEKIHPFSDGNGRIGRLIMQAMLLIKNLPPSILRQEKKRIYISYLRKSQLKEDFIPLEDFICDSILEGLKIIERKWN